MRTLLTVFAALVLVFSVSVRADMPKPGIVIMHGKGGSPTKHVAELAAALEGDGFLVANLEMPWSGRRDYDVDVAAAENEVSKALAMLQQKGAGKVFVAGHSQGGLFALYYGGKYHVDGIIAIAPGGNVASATFREKLAESVGLARKLVADGKGQEKKPRASSGGDDCRCLPALVRTGRGDESGARHAQHQGEHAGAVYRPEQ